MRHWTHSRHTPAHAAARLRSLTLFGIILSGIACFSLAAPAQSQPGAVTRTSLEAASEPGSQTVFTAHVTNMAGNAIAAPGDASVTFDTAHGSLGAARLDDQGNATLTVTSLPADEAGLLVQATYHPSADKATQASVSAPFLVAPAAVAAPDFTVTANPGTVSAKQGGYATTAITVTPLNGFSEQVTLSCSNLPAQVTCNFSPVIETTANGAFTSTLSIQTQTPSGALSPLDLGRLPHTALAWLLPGALALAGVAAARRRAFRGVALAALVVATTLAVGGCSQRYGYNHHPPIATVGTPLGTYTLNIAASGNDGSAVTLHNLNLTLQVQ